MNKVKNIGIDVPAPSGKLTSDPNDPFSGSIKLRGRQFVGTVVSDKPQKTVIVSWERRKKIPKYERYEKRRTRVAAHNPESINAKTGDRVLIAECRPISKTKNFIIIQKLGVNEAKLVKDSESENLPQKKEEKHEAKPTPVKVEAKPVETDSESEDEENASN